MSTAYYIEFPEGGSQVLGAQSAGWRFSMDSKAIKIFSRALMDRRLKIRDEYGHRISIEALCRKIHASKKDKEHPPYDWLEGRTSMYDIVRNVV